MEYPIKSFTTKETFPSLLEVPDSPKEITFRGALPPQENSTLAVVGSRNYSNYGKQAVEYLISGLNRYPITIVSGLALGIDALAHKFALDAGLYTLSVPGSGLNDSVLYPRTNKTLARRILDSGGGLLSEFDPDFKATPWSFPKRNRIMVGLAEAVLLIEATEQSGTLITARLTSDYNKELLAVPGNIFSEGSRGTHQFIKLGAIPVTSPEDILYALRRDPEDKTTKTEAVEMPDDVKSVLDLLVEPKDRDVLIRLLSLPETDVLSLLMKMELDGLIKEQNGIIYRVT